MIIKRQLIFEIEGNCPVKKNQYQYTRKGGKSWGYKPKKVVDYIESALWQLKQQKAKYEVTKMPIENDVAVYLWFEIKERDKDIDGMTTTIYDILQKAEIIKDDKLIVESESIKKKKQPEDITRILIQEL